MNSRYTPTDPGQRYTSEIERLKGELQHKETEINAFRQGASYQRPGRQERETQQYFPKVNKILYDQMMSDQKRHEMSAMLQLQLDHKQMNRQLDLTRRQTEQAHRLEDLRRQREEELNAHIQAQEKKRLYRENLNVQKRLRERIRDEEDHYLRKEVPWMPGSGESPPRVKDMQPFVYEHATVPKMKFSKHAPRHMSFNPITGELRDTSDIKYHMTPPKPQNPFVPEQKNVQRISPEFAPLPAFQQPKFTKTNPKYSPSFPVVGENIVNPAVLTQGFREDVGKFFGDDERQSRGMADYGSMMMRPRHY